MKKTTINQLRNMLAVLGLLRIFYRILLLSIILNLVFYLGSERIPLYWNILYLWGGIIVLRILLNEYWTYKAKKYAERQQMTHKQILSILKNYDR